ncbi:hypothetical protein IV417_13160 [Alphaproteobacteria bacterium KMM 3653]|uniref:Lipoprotein n=1 Tax=Harenicola maris TaxID=2841044 RepID=A0AAP2CR03_9RHOB|nr:hypothetical protein [Harenicola maris]
MRLAYISLTAAALLAACGTPYEQCVSRAERDVRVLDRLIGEVEGNIARGYGLRKETYTVTVHSTCVVGKKKDGKRKTEPCLKERVQTRNVPEAIDLGAERAKLASMKAERTKKANAAQANIASCAAQYPEG